MFGYFCLYLYSSFYNSGVDEIIQDRFPQLDIIKTPYVNRMFLLIVFLIAFGREIFYFIKNITTKYCEK
jgi:hypothetical protein